MCVFGCGVQSKTLFCHAIQLGNSISGSLYHTVCVQMSAVGITENVKGDNKKFEVWYNGREEVYIIQVR